MADVKKITKAEYFGMIKDVVAGSDVENAQELMDFIDRQVELIASKAEKAKARAAKQKAEGDELRDAVQAVLTGKLQVIDEIVAQVNFEDVTKAKVTARLTQLVNAGIAVKEQQKVDSRKVMAYKLADTDEVEAVADEADAE